MNKAFILLLLLCLSCGGFAQLYDKVWVVSNPAYTFTFDSSNLLIDSLPHKVGTRISWSSICDEQGNLEIFTNGNSVFKPSANGNNDFITNGDYLSDTQAANQWYYGFGSFCSNLIFPRRNRKYYVVNMSTSDATLNTAPSFDRLYYAEVDMNANGGNGAVISKRNPLYTQLMCANHLTACKHGNGRDYWLYTHSYADSTFISFLVSPDTILGPYFQDIGGTFSQQIVGQLAFSHDGSKLAAISGQSQLNLFDFDRCSGRLSNARLYDVPVDTVFTDSLRNTIEARVGQGGISLSFSPSGRYLYLNNKYELYQYDLQDTDIARSRKRIYIWNSSYTAAHLSDGYLTPNGQIIIGNWNSGSNVRGMNVIRFPDLPDTSCGFIKETPSLNVWNTNVMSNTFNYRLGRYYGSSCDTLSAIEEVGVNSIKTKLYPNPASEMMELDLYTRDLSEPLSFFVYDIVGREVMRQDIPLYEIQIHRHHLASGVYTWQIQNDKGQVKAQGKLIWE